MRVPAATPALLRRLIVAAVVTGLVVRLVVAVGFDKYVTGDEFWYLGQARALLDGSSYPDPFVRPPGTPWFLAAVLGIAGRDAIVAVRVANALVTCMTPWLVARIAVRAGPRFPWLPAAAAWLQALNPVEVLGVQWAMSENLYVPLTLASVVAALRLAESPGAGRAVVLGVLWAALLHVRVDCTLLVAVVAAWGAWQAGGGHVRAAVRASGPWLGALALAVAACIPWSVHVSRAAGRPVFVAHMTEAKGLRERWGWLGWVSNQALLRKDWLRLYWFGPEQLETAWVGDELFASDAEAVAVRGLIAEAHALGRCDPRIDAEFEVIAKARREATPLRFYVALPLLRTADIWLHPTDSDLPRNIEPKRRSVVTRASDAAMVAWRLVGALGFLAAFVLLFRARTPAGLLAWMIVLRSTSFTFGSVIAWSRASYEARYMANVQPLALIVAALAVAWALDRRRVTRRTAGAAGTT